MTLLISQLTKAETSKNKHPKKMRGQILSYLGRKDRHQVIACLRDSKENKVAEQGQQEIKEERV